MLFKMGLKVWYYYYCSGMISKYKKAIIWLKESFSMA